ncbi:MAG: TIGR02757 family protein [Myxococcaceae bacterium]
MRAQRPLSPWGEGIRAALSPARATALKPLLDAFVESRPWAERVRADPVEFPHRYDDPRDVEVVALISASLAYGRAELFKPKLAWLFDRLGAHPAKAVQALDVRGAKKLLEGFVYRFNLPADLGVLLMGIGRTLEARGSLESHFVASLAAAGTWQGALAGFAGGIRAAAPQRQLVRALGPTRGLAHLLPSAEAGAAKRLNLYLRWMVRGPDAIDFGIWKRIAPSQLLMPLDTHVMRIGRWLGLTRHSTISWRTAEELTASLRLLDPVDPVRYDFAICHYGMSGACPARPVKLNCRRCPLRGACQIGRRLREPSGG